MSDGTRQAAATIAQLSAILRVSEPPSRELSMAQTKLDEARLWLGAVPK